MERKTRFELATLALARRCSTPEPLPLTIGGGRWIRTIESSANGFTVRPLWPLGNPSTYGADDENRTHAISLEGWGSTIELHPQKIKWSGRRDSNSRPSPWQGDALPLSHFRIDGGGEWIRTTVGLASGFTVRPL